MSSVLSDEALPHVIGVEPFPVPGGSRRRRVVGVDIWFESNAPAGPGSIAPALRRALDPTHCRLIAFEPGLEPGLESGGRTAEHRYRARIVANRDDVHVTDEAIAEVLAALAPLGLWSLVRKLQEFDSTPAYPPIVSGPSSD